MRGVPAAPPLAAATRVHPICQLPSAPAHPPARPAAALPTRLPACRSVLAVFGSDNAGTSFTEYVEGPLAMLAVAAGFCEMHATTVRDLGLLQPVFKPITVSRRRCCDNTGNGQAAGPQAVCLRR